MFNHYFWTWTSLKAKLFLPLTLGVNKDVLLMCHPLPFLPIFIIILKRKVTHTVKLKIVFKVRVKIVQVINVIIYCNALLLKVMTRQ